MGWKIIPNSSTLNSSIYIMKSGFPELNKWKTGAARFTVKIDLGQDIQLTKIKAEKFTVSFMQCPCFYWQLLMYSKPRNLNEGYTRNVACFSSEEQKFVSNKIMKQEEEKITNSPRDVVWCPLGLFSLLPLLGGVAVLSFCSSTRSHPASSCSRQWCWVPLWWMWWVWWLLLLFVLHCLCVSEEAATSSTAPLLMMQLCAL